MGNRLFEECDALHEVGVEGAQSDVLLFQQPPGQSTHVPFGADVGTGAHDDEHVVFLSQAAELRHVVLSREVELARFLLMNVPKDIEADGVHAERLAHFDSVFPVGSRDARVVKFRGFDDERFAVHEERSFADGEVVCAFRRFCHCRTEKLQASQEEQPDKESFHDEKVMGFERMVR